MSNIIEVLEIDGFRFQAAWEVVGTDIFAAVVDFHTFGKILHGLNSSLVVLISKEMRLF